MTAVLVTLCVGLVLLGVGGACWYLARQFDPSATAGTDVRPFWVIRGLIGCLLWFGLLPQFFATCCLLLPELFHSPDPFPQLLGIITGIVLVVEVILFVRVTQRLIVWTEATSQRRLLIQIGLVVWLALASCAYAVAHTLSNVVWDPMPTLLWMIIATAGASLSLIGVWFAEARLTGTRSSLPRVMLTVCGWGALSIGLIFLWWISIPLALLATVIVVSTLAMHARARELMSLWALSVAARSRDELSVQLARFTNDSRSARRGPLRRLALRLAEGEPLGFLLPTAQVLPATAQMQIQAGLDAGHLAEALTEAAVRETARFSSDQRIVRPYTLAYIASVGMVAIFIVGFLMYYIIPKFKKIFEDFDTELPDLTVSLISISDAFVNYWYVFALPLGPCVWLAFATDWMAERHGYRQSFGKLCGTFLPRLFLPDVLRGLSWGVRGAQPLHKTLQAMADAAPNLDLERRLRMAATQLEAGQPLGATLYGIGLLTAAEVEFLERAEELGNLPWMLETLAESNERRWEARFVRVSVWLQPFATLALGLIVGFITIALFMPLLKLINDLS